MKSVAFWLLTIAVTTQLTACFNSTSDEDTGNENNTNDGSGKDSAEMKTADADPPIGIWERDDDGCVTRWNIRDDGTLIREWLPCNGDEGSVDEGSWIVSGHTFIKRATREYDTDDGTTIVKYSEDGETFAVVGDILYFDAYVRMKGEGASLDGVWFNEGMENDHYFVGDEDMAAESGAWSETITVTGEQYAVTEYEEDQCFDKFNDATDDDEPANEKETEEGDGRIWEQDNTVYRQASSSDEGESGYEHEMGVRVSDDVIVQYADEFYLKQ
jgi:hypothetical protein